MVGVVIRSSWKCDCRRAAVGPTADPEVILSCCQSSRCHLETHAGRFKSCRAAAQLRLKFDAGPFQLSH